MAWSTHIDTWELAWGIVKLVNRPNFGLLLDAFHIAAKEWADPTIVGNVKPSGPEHLGASLDKLVANVPADRVFFTQAADAELLDPPIPLHPLTDSSMPPLMCWSRNCRLFPYEEKGFMPITKVMAAFVKAGFSGWLR
jgi:4-hydroxyphenylpyruvate dioxygenase